MAQDGPEAESMESLLGDLEEASKLPPRRRGFDIRLAAEKVAGLLYENGALPDDLDRLVELVTIKNHLSQSIQANLVRSMYPTGNVPTGIVLRIVGCLGEGQRKPPTGVQVLLLKWLVMVYHLIDKLEVLSKSYSVLFNLLDQVDLRPHLCQLLALITRRKHVKPHRVRTLFVLCGNEDTDPSLAALLRIFKNYYPEIALGGLAKGSVATFKYPNREWRAQLEEIQQNHLAKGTDGSERPRNGFTVNNGLDHKKKRSIPAVHTFQVPKDSVTLEDINDARGLAQNLERIELPNQLVAVLGDPLLQKLLRLRPGDEAHLRVSNWVTGCVQDVMSGDADQRLLLDMVDTIYEFVRSVKSLPPLFFRLFRELFNVWDGKEKSVLILDILGFSPLIDFDELYEMILQPMEQAVLDNTARSQLLLLKFYKTLLQRWGIRMRYSQNVPSLPTQAVSKLMHHTNQLALTVCLTSSTTSANLAILDFYECAVALYLNPALLPHLEVEVPSSLLVYLLHFDQSLATVSRLYNVVAAYKQALSAAGKTRGFTSNERLSISVTNGLTTDIVNCIWRGKAFGTADKAARGCLVPQEIVPHLQMYLGRTGLDVPVQALFGLSYSPALCLQSNLYMRKLEEDEMMTSDLELETRHAGPVTKRSLARLASEGGLELSLQRYRAGVLRYLEESGFSGVGELMYSTLPKTLPRQGSLSQDDPLSQLSSQIGE